MSMNAVNPKVTVYIVSCDYGKFLGEAIESVLRQTYADWELLLINDGSDDETGEIMNIYKSDKRIRLFDTEGVGLTRSSNIALKHARGEYFIGFE